MTLNASKLQPLEKGNFTSPSAARYRWPGVVTDQKHLKMCHRNTLISKNNEVRATNQYNNTLWAESMTQKHIKSFKKYKCVLCLIKIKHLLSYKHWAINKGGIINITYPQLTSLGDLRIQWLCKVFCICTMELVEIMTKIDIYLTWKWCLGIFYILIDFTGFYNPPLLLLLRSSKVNSGCQ